ncbi:helix-turn-helix domain-containing protein [Allocoleopsis sp.]|uniref:helix-turn-helix domain-containing protein n=1 Tax=Allocoleopsis sp. TaxID=3088169 RepID=UPI002FD7798B
MVMQPTYGNGVIENQTIEISQEGLRLILNQIEAELINSEVYRRTMAGLQTMLGEASNTAQILVKAVGREAVRLTFQQVIKQYNVVPVSAQDSHQAGHQESDSSERVNENLWDEQSQAGTTLQEITQPASLSNRPMGEPKPPKKFTKAEMTAQKVAHERDEMLRKVGQELLQARLTRSLSLQQLHNQTLVPPHHIVALESGHIEQLPEDVYVRGFIRRIAHALGLNGSALIASIPEPDLSKAVVPSWHNSIAVPEFQVNSVHLYLGYTALIAGAVGGLSLMSKQASPGVSVTPEPAGSSHTAPSPKAERNDKTSKPGLQSSKSGVKAGAGIAPPEAMSF